MENFYKKSSGNYYKISKEKINVMDTAANRSSVLFGPLDQNQIL
jgi:hypothetical protein